MFDFLRERGSTAEDKRREALGAYLDNALTPDERARFERQLAGNQALRAELEQMRLLKRQMRAMPRRRVPRSFALNPALYGRPKPQPMMQLYPVLRGATALTAFFLIFTLALGVFRGQFTGGGGEAVPATVFTTAEMAQEAPVEEAAPADGEAAVAEEQRSSDSAAPTEAAAADIAAQEAITGTFAIEAVPPAEATPMPEGTLTVGAVPSTELSLESAAPESLATETPGVQAYNEPPAPVATEIALIAEEETVAGEEDAGQADPSAGMLRLLQIGLGVAFVLLLILWLVARRRVRSL